MRQVLVREPRFVELDGRRIDTASREWLLICLARHICRMPTKELRNAYIGTLAGDPGASEALLQITGWKWSESFVRKLQWEPAAIEALREITKQEWRRMYPVNNQKQGRA